MTLKSPDEDSNNKSKKKTDTRCTLVVSLIQKGTRQRKAVTDGNGCLVIGKVYHIFQNAQVTSNKMEHKERHQFLAQSSIPFHLVCFVLL